MRVFQFLLVSVLAAAVGAAPSSGQWPGELVAVVADGVTGEGLAGVGVTLLELGRGFRTDGTGTVRVRGLTPGWYTLRSERLGYLSSTSRVEVHNGQTSRVGIHLLPAPLRVAGVEVSAEPASIPDRFHLDGRDIAAALDRGATTLGELIRQAPGVAVTRRGPGSPETLSIRGGSADAVLVLLDGAPLNDPVTGEADLSTVPASAVEELTVLSGAQSARWGARAATGAVLVRSRTTARGVETALAAGSLGAWSVSGEGGREVGSTRASLGGELSGSDGSFDFALPSEAGGGGGHRRNADRSLRLARFGLERAAWGGETRLSAAFDRVDRGLPGKAFAAAESARQTLRRLRTSASWFGPANITAYLTTLRVHFRDPRPPAGLPFDERTRFFSTGIRADYAPERLPELLRGILTAAETGFELQHQRISASGLLDGGPAPRNDLGAFLQLRRTVEREGWQPALAGTVRGDRDPLDGEWEATHELSLRVRKGGVVVHATQRSSFSPPTLGDQFFQAGVGVAPNPDLAPERIPSEVQLGVQWSGQSERARWELGAVGFRGDVRGMIVWLPDFRFVWSPRNSDVRRSGGEIWGTIHGSTLTLSTSYGYARVTYDREGDPEPVQVVYRPRHSAQARLERSGKPWGGWVEARYVGVRNPTPSQANELDAFWTVDAGLSSSVALGRAPVSVRLVVRRLFDRTDSLIFGYPEPGRTIELGFRVARN